MQKKKKLSLFGKHYYRERQEYMGESWGMGQRGFPEGIVGTLFYMRGDEYALSGVRFQ